MRITHMEEAFIPSEKGMLVTVHKDVKSYKKYSADSGTTDMRACQHIISGTTTHSSTREFLLFEDVVKEEVAKGKIKAVGGEI